VPRGYVPKLLVLALAWSSSFMFIEFAIEDLTPAATMAARLVVAASVLFGILIARRGFRQAIGCLRQFGPTGIVLGAVATALPFWLIAWGQTHIDSGIAAIGNAAMPIFVALLAIRFAPGERVTGLRAVGIGLGILGVGVLVGVDPQGGLWGAIGTLAVVLAAVSYAGGSLYSQRRLDDTSGLLIMTASTIWGALILLPVGIAQAPSELPGGKAIMAILFMGVVSTALGLLLYIHLVENYGSSRASLVVYLLPVIALFYGAVFLDEGVQPTAIVGLALILGGVALGSGLVRPLRRQEPIPAPTP
jgi:drug/metabolite transporter (DMT)-like permease